MALKLNPENFYFLHSPTKCIKRLYLSFQGIKPAPPGAFQQLLFTLGQRHEKKHLETFPFFKNLIFKPFEKTLEELKTGTSVIYQGTLHCQTVVRGKEIGVTGIPDFLLKEDSGYFIRECKLALNLSEKNHPEIIRQLQVYGWLLEKTAGIRPLRLEVVLGDGNTEYLEYQGEEKALFYLDSLLQIVTLPAIPYSPVGWSKCSGCGYHQLCWDEAYKQNDIALIYGTDQNLVLRLREEGVRTIGEMIDRFDVTGLSGFKKPHGEREQKVGKKAESILQHARAMKENKEILLKKPEIPLFDNYVMFDLEGLPHPFDEIDKIYLWGMQVFGKNRGKYLYALAGTSPEGDRAGWEDFLRIAGEIFSEFGDIPFVHWHNYEKVKINHYKERYGTHDTAERVLKNLLDLLPVTKESIVLPEPSYSLKVVEKYIGYERTQREYGGEWSIAKYIEAVETEDERKRQALIDEILQYNEEDLQATWAVFQWLRKKEGTDKV
jgi:predicted RecB family nuclease